MENLRKVNILEGATHIFRERLWKALDMEFEGYQGNMIICGFDIEFTFDFPQVIEKNNERLKKSY